MRACKAFAITLSSGARSARPTPSKPRPNSASVPGSGTVVAGVNTARMIMSSWLSSGPAPESSQNSHAELPMIDIAIDCQEYRPRPSFCSLLRQPTSEYGPL